MPGNDVLDCFSALTRELLQKMSNNERESLARAAMRDALLTKLISGELRAPEAEAALKEVQV
jgi:type I restriction enzyme, S subunit